MSKTNSELIKHYEKRTKKQPKIKNQNQKNQKNMKKRKIKKPLKNKHAI